MSQPQNIQATIVKATVYLPSGSTRVFEMGKSVKEGEGPKVKTIDAPVYPNKLTGLTIFQQLMIMFEGGKMIEYRGVPFEVEYKIEERKIHVPDVKVAGVGIS